MDNRLLGMDENSRGYSSYFFNRNNTKDHCIIGQANLIQNIRISVAVFHNILPIIIAEKIPALIVSMYDKIHKWFTKKDSDLPYYAWATVITLVLLDVAVVANDIPIIIWGFYDNTIFTDVKVYYVSGAVSVTLLPLFNFVLAYRVIHKRREVLKNPIIFHNRDLTTVIQCTFTTALVIAVQVLSYHSYFITLAIVASPVHSLSFLSLYVTGIFCAMMLAIIIVKLHFKRFFGLVHSIFLGILSLAAIISVIYVITMLMHLVGKHQDSGVVAVVTEMTWSVVLLLLGYCGKKVLSWLG